ncbi:hypothetical protein [Acinetobacter baumannii]|uniref:hypothetical protein n=1 Tax=Acinetobacter baumannii TaxID=470 RepID=UPI003392C50D
MPACATANQWMQSLTQTEFTTSEQHKDSSKTRQEKDHKDTLTVINYVSSKTPFCADMSLGLLLLAKQLTHLSMLTKLLKLVSAFSKG